MENPWISINAFFGAARFSHQAVAPGVAHSLGVTVFDGWEIEELPAKIMISEWENIDKPSKDYLYIV